MMTLIVQTDDGRMGNANGYIDLPTFKAYHDARGNNYSAFNDAKLQTAIVLATDYLDTRFQFIGIKRHDLIRIAVLTTVGPFADGETITIGGKVYTFQTVLTNVDGHIAIGANVAASLLNIRNAINLDGLNGIPGTDFALATTPNPLIVANADAVFLSISADFDNTDPVTILISETCANASFDGLYLSSGIQTTQWPRRTGGDTWLPWFDMSLLDPMVDLTGSFFALVGTDGGQILGIPVPVKRASCEYGFRALSQPLFQDAPAPVGGRLIDSQSVKVDVIEQSLKFAPTQSGGFAMPAYPPADLLLSRAGLIIAGRTLIR